ncbi:MAG TPA: hypothetical protein VNN13_07400 [Methylomirabilota bacterium]|nr:hypothetical protein [Methylomirabilota bacterium]
MSSAREFKEATLKWVTLPSGLTCMIRKLQLRDFVGFSELPLPVEAKPAEENRQMEPADSAARRELFLRTKCIIAAAIEPRFSDRDEDYANAGDGDVVHISYLSETDFRDLVAQIQDWSGLGREAGRKAESFRADSVEGVGAQGRNDLQPVTEQAPGAQPG